MNTRRALVTIEPRGPKTTAERQYQVRFTLDIETAAEKPLVRDIAEAALQPLSAMPGYECHFGELSIKTKTTSIEAKVAINGAPPESAIQYLRTALGTAGFNVTISEQRECDECMATVMAPWGQTAPPAGWHTLSICGKHQYKSCVSCHAVYLMSSTNSGGPAPSLKCTVCDAVMVEWGGTKLWFAELVTRPQR